MYVHIYKPSKNAMQSAPCASDIWVLEPTTTSGKKPDEKTGWTSSENTLSQIDMQFPSKEAAIAFAEEKGWKYTVAKERKARVKPRNYGDNFRYIPAEETVKN
ncbi:MAG: ETC complex I subunit [Alphaproteobacteria bacterium]|nr:ETC complex I subunit [Alphaproteobacteria bacterium]